MNAQALTRASSDRLASLIGEYKTATGVDLLNCAQTLRPSTRRSPTYKKYLGFDCATKTFGHGILHIDLESYKERRAVLWVALLKAVRGLLKAQELKSLENEIKEFIIVESGSVVDLFPGRPDAEIHMVERIKGLTKYVQTEILPKIPPPEDLIVEIEFQMGQNDKTRAIAAALIALLSDYKIRIVGPVLKNKVALTPEGLYANFAKKYRTSYTANKKHAEYNFTTLESLFTSKLTSIKPALRSHVADAVMQILGDLMYGRECGTY